MPITYARTFDKSVDRNLVIQLNENETSDFEKHLRFVYAVHNVLRYIGNNYYHFETQPASGMPMMRVDYNIWYPKRGVPAVLATEVVSGPINIATHRVYKVDRLYKEFELAVVNPPHSLTISLASSGNGGVEFSRLTKIFENGCSDINWQSQMPRFLRASSLL